MVDVAACSGARNIVEMDLEMRKVLGIRCVEREQCVKSDESWLRLLVGFRSNQKKSDLGVER